MTFPTYDQLPISPKYPKGTAWGVWGDNDNLGTLNHLTPERVANVSFFYTRKKKRDSVCVRHVITK